MASPHSSSQQRLVWVLISSDAFLHVDVWIRFVVIAMCLLKSDRGAVHYFLFLVILNCAKILNVQIIWIEMYHIFPNICSHFHWLGLVSTRPKFPLILWWLKYSFTMVFYICMLYDVVVDEWLGLFLQLYHCFCPPLYIENHAWIVVNCVIWRRFVFVLLCFLSHPNSWRREGRGGQKLRSCWLKPRKLVQLMLFNQCSHNHVSHQSEFTVQVFILQLMQPIHCIRSVFSDTLAIL